MGGGGTDRADRLGNLTKMRQKKSDRKVKNLRMDGKEGKSWSGRGPHGKKENGFGKFVPLGRDGKTLKHTGPQIPQGSTGGGGESILRVGGGRGSEGSQVRGGNGGRIDHVSQGEQKKRGVQKNGGA